MLDTKALAAAMAPVIQEAVAKAVSAAEAPLLKRIDALEKRAPEKGEPGQDGANGQDGRDGKDAEPVTDAQIAAAVEAYLAANPPAAGQDGVNGADGAAGVKGIDGKDGADGVGLAGAMIGRAGDLVITLTNGEVKSLGPVVGKDGQHGERGEAGFSLADFDTEFRHDAKTLVLKFAAGDTLETHEIFLPYVRDVGVWKEGATYLEGDGVTWGGSFWTAQKDTTAKPDGSDDWRLAVKRGRDGKDFAGPQAKALEKVRL